MATASSYHPSLALGGVFLSLFGAAWLAAACFAYAGANLPMFATVAILCLLMTMWAILTFRSRRRLFSGVTDRTAGARVRRGFAVVNIVQWSCIGIVVLVLALTDHAAWIMPSVILITGFHFFPLAKLLRYRGYNVTGTGLVLVAALYILFGGAGYSVALTLLATGAILWTSAIALLCAM
ncbi:hypothetical protein [Noviherbaspirillum galbum]|nr:hypothetical protein [Noviherbaspirillum galbum]